MAQSNADAHKVQEKVRGMVPAWITAISRETPTVKRFTLAPQGPLSFLPGQWVDFAAPGITTLGGYSFTSTPLQLHERGTFELAVRRSTHPVATWLHDQAQAGDEVAVRVGGSFTYQPGDERRPLLLLAGGIGINPLLSILRHCCELAGYAGGSTDGGTGGSNMSSSVGSTAVEQRQVPRGPPTQVAGAVVSGSGQSQQSAAAAKLLPPHAAVLYSAPIPAELAFRAELEHLQRWAGGRLRLQLHVTAPEWKGRQAEWGGRWGRVCAADLQHALQWLGHSCGDAAAAAGFAADGSREGGTSSGDNATNGSRPAIPPDLAVLLCGPAAMEDEMIAELRALGVQKQQIRFERWW